GAHDRRSRTSVRPRNPSIFFSSSWDRGVTASRCRGLPEQLRDLLRVALAHDLAPELQGRGQLARLDAELHRQQLELLDRLVGGQAAVRLLHAARDAVEEARIAAQLRDGP